MKLTPKENRFLILSLTRRIIISIRIKNLLSLLLIVTLSSTIAQKPPIKFGKVDIEDLKLEYYKLDSSASAVVLCDYGIFSVQDYQFSRTLRIKILKKEGYNWANKVFYFFEKTNIEGRTYNLVNGEIVVDKLKSESVFKERITDEHTAIRVAMPNVKVGSVIDIKFWYTGMPREWRFQQKIPIKWNELIIERTPYVVFQKNYFGYEPLDVSTGTRWVASDVPAFKPEPYINSVENYITKFEFDIREINIPHRLYFKSIAASWDAICEYILNEKTFFGSSSTFGTVLRSDNYLKKVTDEIEINYTSQKERLIAAYEYAKKVKWNERNSLYPSSLSIQKPYKEEIGNSADINIILIQLLNRLDFEVYPVAISTRDNGRLSKANPSLNKLNYVIAYVKSDSINYLLDATDELLPFGLLPERCMNEVGRIIDEKKSDWIELKTDLIDKTMVYYDLQIEDDLSLAGKIGYRMWDYGAYNFRKGYEQFAGFEDYLDNYKSDKPGLSISDSKIESIDDIYEPVSIEHKVKVNNQAMELNQKVYLTPMIYDQIKQNIFKDEERIYPIDFVYPYCKSFNVKLTIPEGLIVSELPENITMSLPDKSAKFVYSVSHFGNLINVACKIEIKKTTFYQNEYADFKEFYNQIIKKQSEPIIFQIN